MSVRHLIAWTIVTEMIVSQPQDPNGRIQALDPRRQRHIHVQHWERHFCVCGFQFGKFFRISVNA